ncbi:MAG: winged helix-turn-helix transcriptional regulator [Anaerolineaceae bacterium]|nr:winged helix-turn-helix transcriptional regulator [Anaerolineaceae bacterium]
MIEKDPVQFAKAMADDTRQKIMKMICCKRLSVNEIVDQLYVSQPTVSHHLAILRDAGLVSVQEEGKQSYYTLNQERFAICCGSLVLNFAPETETARKVKIMRIDTGFE